MEKIEWSNDFSVGIRRIDEQHQRLFQIFERLVEIVEGATTSKDVANVLDELVEYAQYHFAAEESLMLEYGYPGYKEHNMEHLKFFEQVANYHFDVTLFDRSVAVDLLDFLYGWLNSHVLGTDLKMKPYFSNPS